jgi:predicted RNA-binding protein with RPS1 domain
MRFTRDTPVETIIKGVVGKIDSYSMGFWVEIDGYGINGFVHVSEITGGFVENVSSHVRRGQCISAKYIGVNFQGIQLSIRGVR